MSPATHLLISWVVADAAQLEPRDRKLVTWCGVLPDLDGLGLLADLANELLGRPETIDEKVVLTLRRRAGHWSWFCESRQAAEKGSHGGRPKTKPRLQQ